MTQIDKRIYGFIIQELYDILLEKMQTLFY